jgi:hypothetical protein
MSNLSIVKEGRLTVPLFHGTSSLHLDSIRSAGLGGRNIVEDMGIRRAAQLIASLAADYRADEDWLLDVDACEKIGQDPAHDRLKDTESGFSFSFRYGGTYLSASRETAAQYALLYPNGGEALSYALKLFRRLAKTKPELNTGPCFAPLLSFARQSGTPIVVEARGVPVHMLRTEQGSGTELLLARMGRVPEDTEYYDALVAQHNFELMGPVPAENLRFYSVKRVTEYDGDGGSRQALEFSELGGS